MKSLYILLFSLLSVATLSAQQNIAALKVRFVPTTYTTVYDTIVVSPALNADLDTSNYFTQTHIIVVKEPSTTWTKTEKDGLCIQKLHAQYELVEVKFFPYKNILDISAATNIVPADIRVIARQVVSQPAKIERINDDAIASHTQTLDIAAYSWGTFKRIAGFCADEMSGEL